MYYNLVLSGGALRAIALLGAIKYLEELNILKNIKQYVGTSAGSIISFLIIIGYSSNEIINMFSNVINNITDFNLIARKILISEIKASTQDFSKYGFVHRDYPADTPQEPLIAGMMYFDQSYDGGTAFFHNQMEKAPDQYVSAFPNRLVLYHGGRYHANCFDYTMEERVTFSFFFKLKKDI